MNLSTSLSSSLQTTERALGHDGAYVDEDQEEDLYMLASLRGDIEDETEGGRTFLSGGGTGFGENGGARMVGTVVRKLGAREEYQQRKLVRYIVSDPLLEFRAVNKFETDFKSFFSFFLLEDRMRTPSI